MGFPVNNSEKALMLTQTGLPIYWCRRDGGREADESTHLDRPPQSGGHGTPPQRGRQGYHRVQDQCVDSWYLEVAVCEHKDRNRVTHTNTCSVPKEA